MHLPEIVFIVGPTAVGKTDVGFLLAKELGGEIISCDAMQVYQGLDIVTSKPSLDMRSAIPHHLMDMIPVTDDFDVARFNELALLAIEEIWRWKRIPLVVGGSGMYMQVLLDGIFVQARRDADLRIRLQERLKEEGEENLYAELKRVDPAAASKIHFHDSRRIIRALEVYYETFRPISEWQKERKGLWGRYGIKIFCLNRPRPELYDRINERTERMLAGGLIEEVRALEQVRLSRTANAIIGIKEIRQYLSGEISQREAKEQIQMNTRRLAKRQMTWFRREERLTWMDVSEKETSARIRDRILAQII
jgi:tRNA dimethylallyltransferase